MRIEAKKMALKFTSKIIQTGELYFHTEYFGTPTHPTCLLISGAMATARFWTDRFCTLLTQFGFFVIRYDHRDIGESCEVNWEKSPYTLFDLARDAMSILDGYEVKQAHIVGHSMGGYIAQAIALAFPKRTFSICSISAGPIGLGEKPFPPVTEKEQAILDRTWKIILSRKDGPSKESMIQSFLPIWEYLNGTLPLDKEMAETYTRDLILRNRHPIQAGNHHELVMRSFLSGEQLKKTLQKVDIPTLIIQGEEDYLALPRDGKNVAEAIKQSHLEMVPEMGHMIFHRKLEEKIARVVANHAKNTHGNSYPH